MAKYENETQSMIENPPNLQCRNYPPATNSMIISLTDIPWYPPYTPDGSHYHNCLEIGLCLAGEGMAEMGGGSWRFSAGALLMAPKGVYHAQHNAGTPFTHWRYIAVDSDRMLAQSPHWCAKAIRAALQTTWHGGVYLPPGDEDGARVYNSSSSIRRAARRSSIRCSTWSGTAETSCRSWKPICSCC